MKFRTGIGQDSHRFLPPDSSKPCIIAGLIFDEVPGFHANSDGDVVLHALCNAITSLTGELILGGIADELCINGGITDSSLYLQEAIKTLGNQQISHVAITLEAKKPRLKERLDEMKQNLGKIMGLKPSEIGLTATSGEGLTEVGMGLGVHCTAIISTFEP